MAEEAGSTDQLATAEDNQERIELAPSSPTSIDDPDEVSVERSNTNSHLTPSTALQNEDHYRIDPERWHGLLRGYVRQDWKTVNVPDGVDELRANWGELFFDLIYVASIVHLSAEAAYSIADDDGSHRRLASSGGDATCADEWKYGYILTAFAQFSLLVNGYAHTQRERE